MTAGAWRSSATASTARSTLTQHYAGLLRLALCLGMLVFVCLEVLANTGVLIDIDHGARTLVNAQEHPVLTAIALGADHIGQREPIAGVLLGCASTLAWYQRTRRPVVLSVVALLAVNLVVGALKLGFGRVKPAFGNTAPFEGGMIFPSGHTANVVITWGLLAYLLITYGYLQRRRAAVWIVIGLSLAMGFITYYLDTHWITDIIAGWLIGGILLQALILFDTMWPPRPRRPVPTYDDFLTDEFITDEIRIPDSPAGVRTKETSGAR
ncbi:MAG: phosphatase PAP2 family protein [Actinophytocola sp.]|nr:phosphatase PAP2 family protein [Actinophytocola sp.]